MLLDVVNHLLMCLKVNAMAKLANDLCVCTICENMFKFGIVECRNYGMFK